MFIIRILPKFGHPITLTVCLLLLIISSSAFSQVTTSFSGTLDATRQYTRPATVNGLPPWGTSGVTYNYFTEEFTPAGSGNFDIAVLATSTINDPVLYLYQNSFDPTNTDLNGIIANDDGGPGLMPLISAQALVGGTKYVIVTTSFNAGDSGTFNFNIIGPFGVALASQASSLQPEGTSSNGTGLGGLIDTAVADSVTGASDISAALLASEDVGGALESQGNVVSNASTVSASTIIGQVVNVAQSRVSGYGIGSASARQFASASFYLSSFAPIETTVADSVAADLAANISPRAGQPHNDRGTMWLQALGGHSEIDTDSKGRGSVTRSAGMTAGAEAYLPDNTAKIGAFLGFTSSVVDIDDLGDESDILNYQIGFYGRTELPRDWSLSGTVSSSYIEYETSRPTTIGSARADFDGYGFYGVLEILNRLYEADSLTFSPFAALEASYVTRGGYQEIGAGVLNNNVSAESSEFLTSVLGVEIGSEYTFFSRKMKVSPTMRLGWAHQYLDDNAQTSAYFVTNPGLRFDSESPTRNRDSFRLGLDLSLAPAEPSSDNQWSGYLSYKGDATSNAQDHVLLAGMRFHF